MPLLTRYRMFDAATPREYCFYIEVSAALIPEEDKVLDWLLAETFETDRFGPRSFLEGDVFEVGPRPNFETAYSSTAVDICRACGLGQVTRLERSTRSKKPFSFDRMTHMVYASQPESLRPTGKPSTSFSVDVLGEDWLSNLKTFNREYGCGWDEADLAHLGTLFRDAEKRNPTDVELFQIAQANSEHSRHHRFGGVHVIDGVRMPHSPFELVKLPWKRHPGNSVLAFADDASAIRGRDVQLFVPAKPGQPSDFITERHVVHATNKAETHNHPSMIAPFDGAATGSGGEFRDRLSVGRGGQLGMSAAGYFVGALQIPGYAIAGEEGAKPHPSFAASPLEILVQASHGVAGYGNCFGDPVTHGTVRTFSQTVPDGRHFAYHKPIIYVGGAGTLRDQHLHKQVPEAGMLIVQLGGPGYRIGVGGGAASSMSGGANDAELDFKSVQRGAPQMEQRMSRVIRACIELGDRNPFVSTHDLGAGGLSNAVPELVYPTGGRVHRREIPCGDATLSILELWGNEAQEREVVLVHASRLGQLESVCLREGCPFAVIGKVVNDGRIILETGNDRAVDLPLEDILGSLPRKTYQDQHVRFETKRLELPEGLTVRQALDRVLRLPSVASKGFIVHKKDRSVGGRVARQQCVGPGQWPVADHAILADGYFDRTGQVHALGEQPIAGMLSPQAAARLAVAEAILNLAGAVIDTEQALDGIKMSANWMLAAKRPGRDAWLYDACDALSTFCVQLGCAVDGGKDSLSMMASDVESPPTLIAKAYATMPDVTRHVTPDFKGPDHPLIHVSLSPNRYRLGGSALAQAFGQLGDEPPDADAESLKRVFHALQDLVREGLALSMHDVSDGGLIVTLLEMAFAGHRGFLTNIFSPADVMATLFSQEPGVVIEVTEQNKDEALWRFTRLGLTAKVIAVTAQATRVDVMVNGFGRLLNEDLTDLRAIWTETSHELERLQTAPECVEQEQSSTRNLLGETFHRLTFDPRPTAPDLLTRDGKPKVAIIRAEGSNGDREMAAAFYLAGFEAWDITMSDLLEGRVGLDEFRGVVFVGGFSFADVFDSAKGWAGMIRFNAKLRDELERFRRRPDTFSLGICNGCQLLALLGWVPDFDLPMQLQPRFVHNRSGRFESRFATVRIEDSPALMLKGMAGSVLGCWVAHGEGRLLLPIVDGVSDGHPQYPSNDTLARIVEGQLVPATYAHPSDGINTSLYPFNPNGSALNAAGLCSPDGRHLALMPHPERLVLPWQWPWMPNAWRKFEASPWLRMFQNARTWCEST